jgi:phospholipase/carboxylesterase
MKHIYFKKSKARLIVLLHGTGGDEKSLIQLGEYIDPNASLLGIRGNIDEDGLNRFFKRLRPGVFDEENLMLETNNLNNFLNDFLRDNNFDLNEVVLIGYSNGANILGSLIMTKNAFYKAAILMHPMVPIRNYKNIKLNMTQVLITAGKNDPMVTVSETQELLSLLSEIYESVELRWFDQGHSISRSELDEVKNWYDDLK